IQAIVDTSALPPGRYFARATLRLDNTARGHLVRPFRVVAGGGRGPAAAGVPGAAPAVATIPVEMAKLLVGGMPAFDRADVLAPGVMAPAFAAAEARGTPAKAAIEEARTGSLETAAMTALAGGDQVVAAFLMGLGLLSAGETERAIVQFQ